MWTIPRHLKRIPRRFAGRILWINFVALLLSGNAVADQVFYQRSLGNLSASVTRYATLFDSSTGAGWGTPESNRSPFLASTSGTFQNFRLVLNGSPGGSASYTFTVRKDEASTDISCQVSGSDTSCTSSATLSVSGGDRLRLESVPSGTPTVRQARWTAKFVPTTSNEMMFGAGLLTGCGPTANYFSFQGSDSDSNTESNVDQLAPSDFTIKNLSVWMEFAPGVGVTTTYTSRINAGNGNLTCQIAGASDTTCFDTTNSDVVSEDNLIDTSCSASSTFADNISIGYTLIPSTTGLQPIFFRPDQFMPDGVSTNNRYFVFGGGGQDVGNTTESTRFTLGQTSTLQSMKVKADSPPGGSATDAWKVTTRINEQDTGLTCTITGTTATECEVSSSTAIAVDDDITVFVEAIETPIPNVRYVISWNILIPGGRRVLRTYQ